MGRHLQPRNNRRQLHRNTDSGYARTKGRRTDCIRKRRRRIHKGKESPKGSSQRKNRRRRNNSFPKGSSKRSKEEPHCRKEGNLQGKGRLCPQPGSSGQHPRNHGKGTCRKEPYLQILRRPFPFGKLKELHALRPYPPYSTCSNSASYNTLL